MKLYKIIYKVDGVFKAVEWNDGSPMDFDTYGEAENYLYNSMEKYMNSDYGIYEDNLAIK